MRVKAILDGGWMLHDGGEGCPIIDRNYDPEWPIHVDVVFRPGMEVCGRPCYERQCIGSGILASSPEVWARVERWRISERKGFSNWRSTHGDPILRPDQRLDLIYLGGWVERGVESSHVEWLLVGSPFQVIAYRAAAPTKDGD